LRIRRANERMGELIEALLALSQTSRAPLARENVDLSAMAREILSELQAGDAARAVEIVIGTGLQANGDPRLLRVVMENLIVNAWKFTGRRSQPRIEVGAEPADEGKLCYFVRDNGAGFDMAHATRLFDVFHRLHTDKAFPGTGVGLATVQRVVHRHGGRIWAQAAPDEGATFYFTLG
jgi:light-regulated signal transduction histidine kinase (bacteriophytochrome)